ncbi:MAG: hypothetical protein R6W78_02200 [Bacteroidales bacterium]
MILIKVIIASFILLLIIFAGLGIKLLLGRSQSINIGSCKAAGNQTGCSCSGVECGGNQE